MAFLPTPSHGGRRFAIDEVTFTLTISTHALTWRATHQLSYSGNPLLYFYPRPHMEGDGGLSGRAGRHRNFYPRPHMEGDGQSWGIIRLGNHFYPRPHMEGDCVRFTAAPPPGISTHALTWRATTGRSRCGCCPSQFLPTPSHGGRRHRFRPDKDA